MSDPAVIDTTGLRSLVAVCGRLRHSFDDMRETGTNGAGAWKEEPRRWSECNDCELGVGDTMEEVAPVLLCLSHIVVSMLVSILDKS